MKFHENLLKPEEKEKEITTIHFFTKKNEGQNYLIKILIKFFPGLNTTYKDLAPKILIICHNHLRNKTDIEEYKNDKEKEGNIKGINIVLTSFIDTEDYNIEPLSMELKRNISGINSVSILSLEKKESK